MVEAREHRRAQQDDRLPDRRDGSGTPSEGSIYLFFEKDAGGSIDRFNLAWLLRGTTTGDGELPDWLPDDP